MPEVAVLCGGLGTRLQSVVADRPKALAEVAGRPFLAWLLDSLVAHGFRRALLCTGHRAGQIAEAFGDRHGPLQLAYSQETRPLGTGGALALAAPQLRGDTVLVCNGDSYLHADLRGFVQRHRMTGDAASLLLARVDDTRRYGAVRLDRHDRVIGFAEKAASGGPGWINAGLYMLPRALLAALPRERELSLEREVFPGLLQQGLRGHRCDGGFIDIGTPASYAAADAFFGALAAPTHTVSA